MLVLRSGVAEWKNDGVARSGADEDGVIKQNVVPVVKSLSNIKL